MYFVALDSNVFIAALSGTEHHSDVAIKLIRSISAGDNSAVYSTLTLAEVLSMPSRKAIGPALREFFEQLNGARAYPVSAAVGSLAGSLRMKHPSLRLADAVHLATALESKVDIFITNDLPLAKIAKKFINTATLAEWPKKLGSLA